jgi:hypothetical protein
MNNLTPFLWRVWNTFKTTTLPVVALFLLPELDKLTGISGLASPEIWDRVALGVLASLLGSVIAGTDRVLRHKVNIDDVPDEE